MENLAQAELALVVKHGKALLVDTVEIVAFPAIEAFVKSTPMVYDDIALAALKEQMKAAMLAAIEKIGA